MAATLASCASSMVLSCAAACLSSDGLDCSICAAILAMSGDMPGGVVPGVGAVFIVCGGKGERGVPRSEEGKQKGRSAPRWGNRRN